MKKLLLTLALAASTFTAQASWLDDFQIQQNGLSAVPPTPKPGHEVSVRDTLTISDKHFVWEGFDVTLSSISLTESVPQTFGAKTAPSDAIFVVLHMTVRNISDHGKSFIPQNEVKIKIGGDRFDAEDFDAYWENIQPTLTRDRACYFEVARAELHDGFSLEFTAGLFNTEVKNISVALNPGPTAEELAAQARAKEAAQQAERDAQWKAIREREQAQAALITETEATPTSTPQVKSVQHSTVNVGAAESDLNTAWWELTSRQRAALRQDERNWINYKDALPPAQRVIAIRERANYLWSLVKGE